jgi:Ca2+-binding RTX toxin-like protein
VLKTSYTATGKEPLVGAGSFFFVNFSNMNGSQYKLEYNINRFSTSGKVASAKGGAMDGRNTDGTMVGLGGKDIINGNNGDDLILGGGNSDSLNGGNGDDVIFGGKGSDRLSGNAGKDTFILARNSGLDTIQDFRVGQDHIGLADTLTFQDLSFVKGSGGTIVKAGNQQLALLDGINPNQLSASSFVQSDLTSINGLVSANLATIQAS